MLKVGREIANGKLNGPKAMDGSPGMGSEKLGMGSDSVGSEIENGKLNGPRISCGNPGIGKAKAGSGREIAGKLQRVATAVS